MKDKISIIVPVYNVEAYLDRCLKSIVDQTYDNIEIIIVDDGSTDNSPLICDNWAKVDDRIRVYHKENNGLGMARNTGIEKATGKYICFFDSDDYVSEQTIEKAYLAAESEKAEIVVFGSTRVERDGTESAKIVPACSKKKFVNAEVQEEFLPCLIASVSVKDKAKNLKMNAWDCLYLLDTIKNNNWRFVSEREVISEDVYSLLYLYKHINCVCVLEESLYYYCNNGGSLTQQFRFDRYEKIKQFYDYCMRACDELGYGEDIRHRLKQPYISNTIAALKSINAANIPQERKREEISKIVNDKHIHEVLSLDFIFSGTLSRRLFCFAIKMRLVKLVWVFLKIKG